MAKSKKTGAGRAMYAILETHYDYDDNYYNATEGYSRPVRIYTTREKAQTVCNNMNEDFVIDGNLIAYLSDGIDSFMRPDEIEFMKQFKDLVTTMEVHDELDLKVDFDNLENFEELEKFVRYFQTVYRALPENDERKAKMIEIVQTAPFSVHEVLVED